MQEETDIVKQTKTQHDSEEKKCPKEKREKHRKNQSNGAGMLHGIAQ
jgi:hypothetical protein